MKKMGGNKGFTLVELIIVIAILAIIMLIAIPNFSGIQQRMKVRADKATAAQIGKAVRVWYTDYTSDPTLKSTIDTAAAAVTDANKVGKYIVEVTPHPYALIQGISGYASTTYKPTSLTKNGVAVADQVYVVSLSDTTTDGKVIVGISHATTTGTGADMTIALGGADSPLTAYVAGTTVNYNGTNTGVAYVEP